MFREYNANPKARRGDDCTVRAISKITGKTWEETYMDLCLEGLLACDMPSSNHVWGEYLIKKGFRRHIVPNTCPNCYTVKDFVRDHPKGSYILALHGHVVAARGGNYFDTWDSGDEVVLYYWER